jgi:glutamine amidotransferase
MKSVCVGVIDYKAGNMRSIANALEHVGARVCSVSLVSELDSCTHLVLPGVGAFGFCAEQLRNSGLVSALQDWALQSQRPLLGICVGMQLLADSSDELGYQRGLGWGGGNVRRLRPKDKVRVPHVGWNTVRFEEKFGEFEYGCELDFYFDHSYAYIAPTLAHTVGVCTHGAPFSAIIRRGSVVAAQFHPEKSQLAGLRFLRSFISMSPQPN